MLCASPPVATGAGEGGGSMVGERGEEVRSWTGPSDARAEGVRTWQSC